MGVSRWWRVIETISRNRHGPLYSDQDCLDCDVVNDWVLSERGPVLYEPRRTANKVRAGMVPRKVGEDCHRKRSRGRTVVAVLIGERLKASAPAIQNILRRSNQRQIGINENDERSAGGLLGERVSEESLDVSFGLV